MTPDPGRPATGHRTLPHTADARIEAWAPDRERCLAEAVAGLVGSFADLAGAGPQRTATVHIAAAPTSEMLVQLLEEVIYLLDVEGELPVDVTLAATADGGLDARLAMTHADAARAVGAAPKAVSLHRLHVTEHDGCSCTFTVDV